MLGVIRIYYLVLALAFSSSAQSPEKYLLLKVSDTAEEKVSKIVITCKESCAQQSPVNGMIRLKLPPQILAGNSITLEIVKRSDHPDWMIVSPSGGLVTLPSEANSDKMISVTVVSIGREDPDNVHRLDELARRYFEQKKYAEAKVLCQKALEIDLKLFGPEHVETAEILRHLAYIYEEEKNYAEAEALYERVLKIYEKTQPEDPETALTLTYLAAIYHHREKYMEIAPLYKRAFDIYDKTLGFDRTETENCFKYLIKLYLSQSQFEQLDGLYKHALAFYEKKDPGRMSEKQRKKMIAIIEQYGEFLWQEYQATHNPDEAMKLLGRAYDLKEGAENRGANAKPDPKRQMTRYIRTLGHHGLPKEIAIEIREYKHPLLSKYLPDYKFYIPYVPAHPAIYDEEEKTLKFDKSEGWYGIDVGIADRENHLWVFNYLSKVDFGVTDKDYDRAALALVYGFLNKARIKKFAPVRTDLEMQEITKLFLTLNSLKNYSGPGFPGRDEKALPVVRDFKTEAFKVGREEGKTTVSYNHEDDHEIVECYLSFDRQGNITGGNAYKIFKVSR